MVLHLRERIRSGLGPIDRVFAGLRLLTIGGGIGWLLFSPISHPERERLFLLFSGFCTYSLLLYGVILARPGAVRRAYLVALGLDLLFIVLLIRLTGGFNSDFYLAFYLLVALHTFYYGLPVGLVSATGGMLLYIGVGLSLPYDFYWGDIGLRIAFLFLIAVSVGLAATHERRHHEQIAHLNRDLMARNRLIQQSYRLASIGRLAEGIAHEINNPAGVIAGRAEYLVEEAQSLRFPKHVVEDLATIVKHAGRIGQITKSLLTFAGRIPSVEFRPLDVGKIIEETIPLLHHRLSTQHITVRMDLLQDSPVILGNLSSLQQTVFNLLNNAADAMPEGGILTVTTRCKEMRNPNLQFPISRWVEVVVADTGVGMSEEVSGQIFDPFFTTKDVGEGTGLGLSLCYGVIKDHGGRIEVTSTLGKGTTVFIVLPCTSYGGNRCTTK